MLDPDRWHPRLGCRTPLSAVSPPTTPASDGSPCSDWFCECSDLPAQTLERSEAHLYPEPKCVPAHSGIIRSQVGHHQPRLVRPIHPHHNHRSPTTLGGVPERCTAADICMIRSWDQMSRSHTCSSLRAEHGVDRLSDARMPAHRAYLLPQSRTPQFSVTHHHHTHVVGHGVGQQIEQPQSGRYPLARSVRSQHIPGHWNRTASIDHLMTIELSWSPFIVGSIARASLSDCHRHSTHLNSGAKHDSTSICVPVGLALCCPSYSHCLRY